MTIAAQLGVVSRFRQTSDQLLVGARHKAAEQVRQHGNEPRHAGMPLASAWDMRHETGRRCGIEYRQ
ncbi:hypothetical protein CJ301_14475 [Limimaricola cinnabarinus]|uniref:Uncharacterized protein n=1 Tax=Limimaricola cinnabarinus TaxID=1125964 RepID=A0A2G1MDK4_9RHOB|nr:hypothetical protein CJ301_14475 [Limimaricola cinnabarinus]